MKKIKAGDILKIPKKDKVTLIGMSLKIQALRDEIEKLSESVADCDRERWTYLYSIFPELSGFKASYDYGKSEILIMRESEEWEKESRAFEVDTWKVIKKAKEKGWFSITD